MSEANQKLPSTASAAVIANTAALSISQLRASFNLRRDAGPGANKPSKYAALVRRAEQEDLKIPQYNVGIGGRPDGASAAKTANDDLRRKLMLDRKRGPEALRVGGQESSDEDEGRSALGRSKRAKRAKRAGAGAGAGVTAAATTTTTTTTTTSPGQGDIVAPCPAEDKSQDARQQEPRGQEEQKEESKTTGDAESDSESKENSEVQTQTQTQTQTQAQTQDQGLKKKKKKKNKNKKAAATA